MNSVCDNNVVGDSNTVNNICIDSNCFHPFSDAEGTSNTLNRNCQGISNPCDNRARGDSNTQNMNCANANDQPATCLTSAVGDSNTQNMNCQNSGVCFNSKPPGFPVTTQNTACQSSGECGNGGIKYQCLSKLCTFL